MNYKENIGYIATIISLISFFPIILNIAKTKKTNNFPYKTIILSLIANLLFLYNGFLTNNYVIIFMGGVFTLIYLFIFYIKIFFSN